MTLRSLRAIAVVAFTVAGVATTVTGAQAVPVIDCPHDAIGCLYDGDLGTGDRYVIRRCGVYDLPYEWWDKANSFYITDRAYLRGWNYGRKPGDSSTPTMRYARSYDFDNIDNRNATDWIHVQCAV
ncbi:hypothetical protein GCM10022247_64660 [Allokutzneria multivorans]|uniref:Peptidase inhibitor family I36 n=1 Tax=Allokutzneria multivorans TaxID=1142134 RepID=A0ABP7TSM2_9PSEU